MYNTWYEQTELHKSYSLKLMKVSKVNWANSL